MRFLMPGPWSLVPGRMNTAITIISGSLGIARNASTILMIKNQPIQSSPKEDRAPSL